MKLEKLNIAGWIAALAVGHLDVDGGRVQVGVPQQR